MNLIFILPVYNSKEIIESSINTLLEYLAILSDQYKDLLFFIFIVNDGSNDDTLFFLKKKMKYYYRFEFIKYGKKGFIYCFSYERNRGVGFAIKFALKKLANIYKSTKFNQRKNLFFIMDFDLPFDLSIINESIKNLSNYDLVNIDRTKKRESYNVSYVRKIMHRTLIYIIKLLFLKELKGIDDYVGGFKAFNDNFFNFIKDKYFISNTSLIQLELLLYAVLNRFKIFTVFPVFRKETLKFSTFNIFKTFKFIFKVLFELILIRFNLGVYK